MCCNRRGGKQTLMLTDPIGCPAAACTRSASRGSCARAARASCARSRQSRLRLVSRDRLNRSNACLWGCSLGVCSLEITAAFAHVCAESGDVHGREHTGMTRFCQRSMNRRRSRSHGIRHARTPSTFSQHTAPAFRGIPVQHSDDIALKIFWTNLDATFCIVLRYSAGAVILNPAQVHMCNCAYASRVPRKVGR
jgi:hypothetical protein